MAHAGSSPFTKSDLTCLQWWRFVLPRSRKFYDVLFMFHHICLKWGIATPKGRTPTFQTTWCSAFPLYFPSISLHFPRNFSDHLWSGAVLLFFSISVSLQLIWKSNTVYHLIYGKYIWKHHGENPSNSLQRQTIFQTTNEKTSSKSNLWKKKQKNHPTKTQTDREIAARPSLKWRWRSSDIWWMICGWATAPWSSSVDPWAAVPPSSWPRNIRGSRGGELGNPGKPWEEIGHPHKTLEKDRKTMGHLL